MNIIAQYKGNDEVQMCLLVTKVKLETNVSAPTGEQVAVRS